ncbi:MAG: type II 3-dehydroquinate dehydratase [Desulforegulaceae bacterium]|nr:type II 3-dehydroquinate dehydratase [Desulforegulaceae bacterium]
MKKLLVINGPNLNMLGKREPEIYGEQTLEEINSELKKISAELGIEISFFQSNHEGEIVSKLNQEFGKIDGLIINAAAYTHTSIAIRDAVLMHKIPVCEVHLSNIYKREKIRHKSYLSDISTGVICGFGSFGYQLALKALSRLI